MEMISAPLIFVAIALAIAFACIRILAEYERGVVFRLGRFNRVMQAFGNEATLAAAGLIFILLNLLTYFRSATLRNA